MGQVYQEVDFAEGGFSGVCFLSGQVFQVSGIQVFKNSGLKGLCFQGSGVSVLMFFRGRVFQESGFTGVWFISRLVFSDDRYFRGLVLQVSGFTGVKFIIGQVFQGSVC